MLTLPRVYSGPSRNHRGAAALLNTLGAQYAKEKVLKGVCNVRSDDTTSVSPLCVHSFSGGVHKKHTPYPGQARIAAVQGKGERGLLLCAAGLWALSSLWFTGVKEQIGPDPSCDLPSFFWLLLSSGHTSSRRMSKVWSKMVE